MPKQAITALPLHPLAQEWAEEVYSGEYWEQDPSRPANPGEAGGYFVRALKKPLLAYLKPLERCTDAQPRAANEKIVADLAFFLGIPVPPVQLYPRAVCPTTEERRACVSLVTHPTVWEWSHVIGLTLPPPVAHLVRAVLARDCGVIALDTWIAHKDRNSGRNGLIVVDPARPAEARFAFLDSSFSLNDKGQWEDGHWADVRIPEMPALLQESVDPSVLEAAVQAIEQFDEEEIKRLVGRIPDEYMIPAHRSIVKRGLVERRALIRSVLAPAFGL